MTETSRRVEPLPDPFVVGDDAVRASPLRSRAVFLLLPDTPAVRRLRDALGRLPGVAATGPALRMFAHGIERVWADYQWVDHMGTATMVSAQQLLGALRRLADEVLTVVAAGATWVVEWSPDHADRVPAGVVASLYPDAHIVVTAETLPYVAGAPNVLTVDPADVLRDASSFARLVEGLGIEAGPRVVDDALRTDTRPAASARARLPTGAAAPPSALRDRLVVVVGAGRSGTTWLEELFMAHPRVGGVRRTETSLFMQLSPMWTNARSADGAGLSAYVDDTLLAAALRRFCDTLFVDASRRHTPDADYFVEKSPVHSWRLPEIAAVYPDAWFVHLLRDGRDVARSMSQVPFFRLPDPADAARVWRQVVTTVRRDASGLARYREVGYERLYDDPVREMTALFRWIGLDVDASVQAALRAKAGQRVSVHAGTGLPVGPGGWRSLPARTVADIYRAAGDLLVAEGYATRADVLRARIAPSVVLGRIRRAHRAAARR